VRLRDRLDVDGLGNLAARWLAAVAFGLVAGSLLAVLFGGVGLEGWSGLGPVAWCGVAVLAYRAGRLRSPGFSGLTVVVLLLVAVAAALLSTSGNVTLIYVAGWVAASMSIVLSRRSGSLDGRQSR
jgi:hypothetical protein